MLYTEPLRSRSPELGLVPDPHSVSGLPSLGPQRPGAAPDPQIQRPIAIPRGHVGSGSLPRPACRNLPEAALPHHQARCLPVDRRMRLYVQQRGIRDHRWDFTLRGQ